MKVLWLSALTCHANAHALMSDGSFEALVRRFEWVYHPLIQSAFGLVDVCEKRATCDLLILEGTIGPDVRCLDYPIFDLIEYYGAQAKWVVSLGTCATFGGIFKEAHESLQGLHFRADAPRERFAFLREKSIALPGCPTHPTIVASVMDALLLGVPLALDEMGRPKRFFSPLIHHGCTRNEYFEYKIDGHRWGEREGCLFYDHGCQAPYTRGSCNTLLWNTLSSKTRSGQPCMGCTEPTFPKKHLWSTTKHMGIPQELPLGVSKRAYLTLTGITKAFKIPRLERHDDTVD